MALKRNNGEYLDIVSVKGRYWDPPLSYSTLSARVPMMLRAIQMFSVRRVFLTYW